MDNNFGLFQGDSQVLQLLGRWGYKVYDERELLVMYVHLLASALFPIYIGSHASLRRPPSAALPSKKASKSEADEDDDEFEEPVMEGLSPTDAIMFPVLAGCVLSLLYVIIKWLNDPTLLNKLLGWYFSAIGVFGVGKLAADGLNVATTFVFPSVWATKKDTYYVDPLLSQQVTGQVKPARVQIHRKFADKSNPLPGVLSSIKFSSSTNQKLWSFRALLKQHWIFRGYLHGIFSVKSRVQLNDVLGLVIGFAAIILYNLNGKVWWLTNLIGFGFCYGTLQLMSPTTFWTGSLVLAGLFVYDIAMVFYTPLMVTVATSLDVPIKLVFPGPKRGGMLGLGDVVLPGIMMALALRFDLYLHYLRKQTAPAPSSTMIPTNPGFSAVIQKGLTKAPYLEATSNWGERFWTSRARKTESIPQADGSRFPKTYFKASVVGYVAAMLVTLVVMNIYQHAQPALLYLVPGVLISLWGTAAVRDEWKLMWEYTEDGSLEEDYIPERDSKDVSMTGSDAEQKKLLNTRKEGSGELTTTSGAEKSGAANTDVESKADTLIESGQKKSNDVVVAKVIENEHAHHVFLFSLSSPKETLGLPKASKLLGTV